MRHVKVLAMYILHSEMKKLLAIPLCNDYDVTHIIFPFLPIQWIPSLEFKYTPINKLKNAENMLRVPLFVLLQLEGYSPAHLRPRFI